MAFVNAKNNKGYIALMAAAQEGQTETVQALLAKGADVNTKNKRGCTALMLAKKRGITSSFAFSRKQGRTNEGTSIYCVFRLKKESLDNSILL
jgi:ankyrin repeat protein